jgi:hypothetical protein
MGSSHASANHIPPLSFEAAQSALAGGHNIHVRRLPASVAVTISQQQAEATALNWAGETSTPGVTSFAVTAHKGKHPKPPTDGRAPLIPNGPVWLVLIPNHQIPNRGPGPGPHDIYRATLAVLIDVSTGDYIMAAAPAS